MVPLYKKITGENYSALSLLITSWIVSFLYVFLEWLFIVTKPSFMSVLTIIEKIWVLTFGVLFLAVAASIPLFILAGINFLINRNNHSNALIKLGFILPIITASFMVLLLIDNFTYTVFKFGIISTTGSYRAIYIVVLLLIMLVVTRELFRLAAWIDTHYHEKLSQKRNRRNFSVLFAAAFLMAMGVPLRQGVLHQSELGITANSGVLGDAPNIILFTVDSLDASHMSLYGYSRETTPFMEELASSSLVAANAFTNAQGTIGSITSMLTGKDPMETRVLLSDDILRGEDSYQHLPGIMRSHGYRTYQLSFSSYADAVDINFLNAFDLANGRKEYIQTPLSIATKYLPSNNAYFYFELESRLTPRLKHIFFIEEMENPYKQVTQTMEKFDDEEKFETLISILEEETQPVFVHFHWMGVHGPKFYPQTQVFSSGKDMKAQKKDDMDFYDDSILEVDQSIQELYSFLETEKESNRNTILIIAADHSLKWAKVKLPLIIHFPEDQHAGVIEENAQNLDIAPTLLDYLDIPQPDWMVGQSLLAPLDKYRPIFTTRISSTKKEEQQGNIQIDKSFYPFGKISVAVCDTWYEVRLPTAENSLGNIPNYQGSCDDEKLTSAEGFELILEHLHQYGFDTATLEDRIILK